MLAHVQEPAQFHLPHPFPLGPDKLHILHFYTAKNASAFPVLTLGGGRNGAAA